MPRGGLTEATPLSFRTADRACGTLPRARRLLDRADVGLEGAEALSEGPFGIPAALARGFDEREQGLPELYLAVERFARGGTDTAVESMRDTLPSSFWANASDGMR